MKRTGRLVVLAVMVVSLACTGGSGGGSGTSGGAGGGTASGTLKIAVIPKGTSHVFWQSIHAGAVKAAREVGAEVIWRGPLREDDRDSQVSEVEGFVSRGVSGIVLAPLDDSALVAPVTSAMRAKIPVVIIDSGLKGGEYVSFVATDNGRAAGWAASTWPRCSAARARSSCCATRRGAPAPTSGRTPSWRR
jgi:ribose transport system substrate-binding protein